MEAVLNEDSSFTAVVEGLSREPILFARRRYLDAIPADASTTSCQKTSNPADYGPDD